MYTIHLTIPAHKIEAVIDAVEGFFPTQKFVSVSTTLGSYELYVSGQVSKTNLAEIKMFVNGAVAVK